ncbi:MAG: hypothetical protein AB1451_12210 [Nitrospirota bacterium]
MPFQPPSAGIDKAWCSDIVEPMFNHGPERGLREGEAMTKTNRSTRRVVSAFWVGLLAGALGACGDQNLFESLADGNTAEAKIESAKIAIDNGNYTEAIAILQGLCGTNPSAVTCDAETASLLASAYSGRAGLNVFDLIENSVNTTIGATNSFSSFSILMPSPSAGDVADLHAAVEILANLSNPTPNQYLQMAISAMADIVVTAGVELTNGFKPNGRPNTVPTLTEVQSAQSANGTVSQISDDLDLVVQGLAGVGLSNEDLTSDLAEIKTQLDGNNDSDVSDVELQAFLALP